MAGNEICAVKLEEGIVLTFEPFRKTWRTALSYQDLNCA